MGPAKWPVRGWARLRYWDIWIGKLSISHVQRVASCIILITNYRFPSLESKGGLERHGLNVWRLMPVIVAWLALSQKTEMYGNPVLGMDWCFQLHRMGHGQHFNLKMDMGMSRLQRKPKTWHNFVFICPKTLEHEQKPHFQQLGYLKSFL